jgi:tetratricopeptide (TPR) repeat protein
VADRLHRPSIRQRIRFALRGAACFVLLACACGTALADEPPQRARDTGYGMALYEYHQGNFFQALTRLNMANSNGGIAGHGDHPLLVEGGLMLGYGMTREARTLFQNLLEESDVSEQTRNQAWFYLGKVFWLEGDADASADALERVNGDLLEDTDEALYEEWLYLKGQWLLRQNEASETGERLDDIVQELPEQSPWSWYLRYNRALQWLAAGDLQAAVDGLSELIAQAVPEEDLPPETADELSALEQQARLSLGRLHLGQGDFEQAMAVLDDIPLDGLLSDQALFDYAVAASRQGRNGLALQALDTLQSRPLFTPWLQQVPFARAFTIEQMKQPKAALEAYRTAAEHYVKLDQRLAAEQLNLTEEGLIKALNFVREGSGERSGEGAGEQGSAEPSLGETAMLTDSYGRVKVRPQDFSLAELLAGEAFQLALRDLHELYRLDNSLNQWREQLASFDGMLDTRRSRREARIRETREALASLNADEWISLQADFRRRIEQATEQEEATFFMTAGQRQLRQQLDRVEETLTVLPDDDSTRKQRQTYERMRAYFNWRVADEYSVNRWAAVRQLRELDEAMDTFVSQRQLMEQEMLSDARLDEFAGRIVSKSNELNQVDQMLGQALNQTRQDLMALVKSELTSQRREIAGYLRASRHAQARLADRLFLKAGASAAVESTDEQGIESEAADE